MMNEDKELKVSIVCDCYNHEKYIAEALDGFLMQKCNFDFEILIHDDASTDNSAKIIKEYELKYPEIIKPIYQTENQYSQKKNIWGDIQFSRAKGKYIAICEGDDYWIDPLKLQKQVDFLEKNEDCNLVYHRVKIYDQEENTFSSEKLNISLGIRKRTLEELALQGNLMHTPSVLFRNNLILPEQLFKLPVGDYVLWFLNGEKGNLGYLPDEMAVYRSSNSSVWGKKSDFYRIDNWLKVLLVLKKYTNNNQIKTLLTKQAWNNRNYVYTSKLSLKEKYSINKILLKIEPKFIKRILLNRK